MSILLLAASTLLLGLLYSVLTRKKQGKGGLPPGPSPIPLLGNLHQFDNPNLHHNLPAMAQKYGPIMTVWFGGTPVVLLNTPEMVREAFEKRGVKYSSRPNLLLTVEIMQHGGTDMALAPYGEWWRKSRRVAHNILNVRAVKSLDTFVESEVLDLLRQLGGSVGKPISSRRYFKRMAFNIILRVCFGFRYENVDDPEFQSFMDTVADVFELSGPHPINFFPWLRYVPGANSVLKKGIKTRDARDAYINSKLALVRQQMKADGMEHIDDESNAKFDINKQCFVRSLLAQQQAENISDAEITGLCGDLLLAGVDTSSTTLEWAVYILCNYPQALEKAQKELDSVVPRSRLPTMEDIPKLPYLRALLQEVFRFRNVAPLSVPHCTTEEDELEGYVIPANTQVFMSTYGINMSPEYFPNPEQFMPERFLNHDGKSSVNNPSNVMSFGAGRRVCVGSHLGMTELNLTFSRVLFCFTFKPAAGAASLEEKLGLTLQPAHDSPVIYTLRDGIDLSQLLARL